ncbi:MAG: type I glyceraldehyde-3-phosphate dehydrogenase [candidate division Zixibacteria bacterium]|nr:type I glyceraldehyde-3-phosphate dehydrogenase [candidate division Zixibacteria bacterium]
MSEKIIPVGINGYGRIGRSFHRIALKNPYINVVAINSRSEAGALAHLLQYDSVYGTLNENVIENEKSFFVKGETIAIYQESSPGSIPWGQHEVEIVVDATGKFTDTASLSPHLRGNVRHVVVCCPPEESSIPSIVMGVNDGLLDTTRFPVVSNASCTTHALIPVLKTLDDAFGVVFCSFRTIHSLTDSQHLLDNADRDLRRARAAMESIIPASTGASSSIRRILPHLDGRVNGMAYRVPTRTVSNIDLTVRLSRRPDVEEINGVFVDAACGALAGVLGVTSRQLVSIDFKGDPHSVIVDLPLTTACGDGFYTLAGWYDNEWGFSNRLVALVERLAGVKTPDFISQTEEATHV